MPRPAALAPALSRLLAVLAPPEAVPLSRWRDAILSNYTGNPRSTRDRFRQALDAAVDLAGPGATTLDLTPALVGRFAAALGQGRKPSTVNGLLRALRAGCNEAVRRGWLAECPFPGWADWPDEDLAARKHHPAADVARVLAHLRAGAGTWEGGRLFALAAVLAYCGLRLREALRLRVEEIDLEGGSLAIERTLGRRLKTRGSRAKVPMPDALVAILRDWLPRAGSAWAFPGSRRRAPWDGAASGKRPTDRLKAAGQAAGVEGFTPQSLRRSLATHLVAHSGKPRLVQGVLRHARQATSELYIKEDLANMRAAVRGFDFATPPPPPSPPPPPAAAARIDRGHVLPRRRLGRRPTPIAARG